MHRNTKIATCCYCSARTALVLDEARHELCCAKCGAPLHDLKRLPKSRVAGDARPAARPAPAGEVPPEVSGAALEQKWARSKPQKPYKPRKVKKRKPLWKKALGEIGDLIEDVFD